MWAMNLIMIYIYIYHNEIHSPLIFNRACKFINLKIGKI